MESLKTYCKSCLSPLKRVWVPLEDQPKFELLHSGHGVSLHQCEQCGSLWCATQSEPFGTRPVWVIWEEDREAWIYTFQKDQGEGIRTWHRESLKTCYQTLSPYERKMVEEHLMIGVYLCS